LRTKFNRKRGNARIVGKMDKKFTQKTQRCKSTFEGWIDCMKYMKKHKSLALSSYTRLLYLSRKYFESE
jgi:hypothetical protein